ncbi:hypothetical protein ACFL6I_23305 [candidate division KSB1 bacterium]
MIDRKFVSRELRKAIKTLLPNGNGCREVVPNDLEYQLRSFSGSRSNVRSVFITAVHPKNGMDPLNLETRAADYCGGPNIATNYTKQVNLPERIDVVIRKMKSFDSTHHDETLFHDMDAPPVLAD